MSHFTPWAALGGGVLIGLAAVLLLWLDGRIAGISGIAGGLWFSAHGDRAWRICFVAGLIVATGAWALFGGRVPPPRPQFPIVSIVLAGLLVGYGTSLAGGCTSGHGVCGVARLSRRSLAATGVFLGAALATTFAVRHLLPGA